MIMDTKKWVKNAFITVAVVTVAIVALCGLLFGKIVEATLFEEIAKWVLLAVVLAGIMCVICYAPIMILGHIRDEYEPKYGKKWFWNWFTKPFKKEK